MVSSTVQCNNTLFISGHVPLKQNCELYSLRVKYKQQQNVKKLTEM